jgi:hypothetical protein
MKIKFLHEVRFVDSEEENRLRRRVQYLENVIDKALLLTKKLNTMGLEIDKLETEVSENTSATDSAITLLSNLASAVREVAGDKAKTLALATQLDSNSNRLADAVAANTIPAGGGETGGGETGGGETGGGEGTGEGGSPVGPTLPG